MWVMKHLPDMGRHKSPARSPLWRRDKDQECGPSRGSIPQPKTGNRNPPLVLRAACFQRIHSNRGFPHIWVEFPRKQWKVLLYSHSFFFSIFSSCLKSSCLFSICLVCLVSFYMSSEMLLQKWLRTCVHMSCYSSIVFCLCRRFRVWAAPKHYAE